MTFKVREAKEADPVVTATQVCIILPCPVTVEAG